MAALTEAFCFTDLTAILAVAEDKDVAGILDELEPVVTPIWCDHANSSPRSMPAAALAEVAAGSSAPTGSRGRSGSTMRSRSE